MTIHWCGTGLSAVPGLRRLIEAGHPSPSGTARCDKAREAVGDLTDDIRPYSLAGADRGAAAGRRGGFDAAGGPACAIAKACLAAGAHFVSSSYIAPEMRELDARFAEAGLVCVNEVGLDPGIDHLMAHDLVARYRASAAYSAECAVLHLLLRRRAEGGERLPLQVQLVAPGRAEGAALALAVLAQLQRAARGAALGCDHGL
jgi:hypothetical protein